MTTVTSAELTPRPRLPSFFKIGGLNRHVPGAGDSDRRSVRTANRPRMEEMSHSACRVKDLLLHILWGLITWVGTF